jgi:hypothetical protein
LFAQKKKQSRYEKQKQKRFFFASILISLVLVNVEKKEGKKEIESEVQNSFAKTGKKEERNLCHKDTFTSIKLIVKNERKT